jgi:NTE family protein
MNAQAAKQPLCVLVLQGGGALGAYHIGAYQALREAGLEPDWVCGISMGAINGALIAGNPPEQRLARLEAFWQTISRPGPWLAGFPEALRSWQHTFSYVQALEFGQPGFFRPRLVNPWLAPPGPSATSYYDTEPLYDTLRDLVAFERLNANVTRLTVGATDVQTGKLVFFDTADSHGRFRPAHIVASGSLPPGFPATEINGRSYWDGGNVSNSPLRAVLKDPPAGHAVVFVLDLWSASGPAPQTMSEVDWRSKQIRYASITPPHIDGLIAKMQAARARQLLGHAAAERVPARLDLLHVTYRPSADQISSSDAEFSRDSIAERRAAGLADLRRALATPFWRRAAQPGHLDSLIHRLTQTGVETLEPGQLLEADTSLSPSLSPA